MLNNALRFIREGKIDTACAEIVFAIEKANGYFHKDIAPTVEEIKNRWVEAHAPDLFEEREAAKKNG